MLVDLLFCFSLFRSFQRWLSEWRTWQPLADWRRDFLLYRFKTTSNDFRRTLEDRGDSPLFFISSEDNPKYIIRGTLLGFHGKISSFYCKIVITFKDANKNAYNMLLLLNRERKDFPFLGKKKKQFQYVMHLLLQTCLQGHGKLYTKRL